MTLGIPAPSVLHLMTLFRQISAGQIRIPAFQRSFVWDEDQMLELLGSVRQGYPIGSLLFWQVDDRILKIAAGDDAVFPHIAEKYPTDFVLDGMQRLTTLYGVFHFGQTTTNNMFDVWFDLSTEKFFHADDPYVRTAASVPLASLLDPKRLLEVQAKLFKLQAGEMLVDRLSSLQASFQDYMIPVVRISGDEIAPVVNIFERVNSTGTRLSRVDFMRAITWKQDFDLAHALEDAQAYLGTELNFELDAETILKCVALEMAIAPAGDALLELRSRTPGEMLEAFESVKNGLHDVAMFADRYMHIYGNASIPYEGQLLLLYEAVKDLRQGSGEPEALAAWFWATCFNESLRGKPDHYVVRALVSWRDAVEGRLSGLEPRLRLGENDFIDRRLIKGKALSVAFAGMFAHRNAQSLVQGLDLEPIFYTLDGDTAAFQSILPLATLRELGLGSGASAKILANLVVHLSSEEASLKELILSNADASRDEVLKSQFMDEEAVSRLRQGDAMGFLRCRANAMLQTAREMVGA